MRRFLILGFALSLGACTAQTASKPKITNESGAELMVGRNAEEVRTLLGEPDFVRLETPAQVWRYGSAICFLDLYLYDESGTPKVTYAKTRGMDENPVEPAACFEAVQAN